MYRQSWFIKVGTLGFHLILLNICFWLGSVLGLGIIGFFPSLAALFYVLRQMIVFKDDDDVFKKYWKSYKENLLKANLLGYLYVLAVAILYGNYRVALLIDHTLLSKGYFFIIILLTAIVILSLLTVFPVFVHYHFPLRDYPKVALIYSVARPIQTIISVGLVYVLAQVMLAYTALFLLLGVSLMAYVIMRVAATHFLKEDD